MTVSTRRADGVAHTRSPAAAREPKRVNLALPGGGTHGAFSWGVLDRLLDESALEVIGISATSAGAMNAILFVNGLARGGRDGARRALAQFWRHASHVEPTRVPMMPPFGELMGNLPVRWSPTRAICDLIPQLLSPYQFNPLGFNPIRATIERLVDFESIREAKCPVRLLISSLNARSGAVRVVGNRDIDLDSVMAACCSPILFHAVEIGGEPHWDAGYAGHPALFPESLAAGSDDLIIVHVPPQHGRVRLTAKADIHRRISELAFASALEREVRAIEFKNELIENGQGESLGLRRVKLHEIRASDDESCADPGHVMTGEWETLCAYREAGRAAADRWLVAGLDAVGHSSTASLPRPTAMSPSPGTARGIYRS